MHAAFVIIEVYVGFDNYKEAFFSQFPEPKGAPHFWIVPPQRQVLSSQPTGGFEAGKSTYDKQAFLDFIDRWKARAEVFAESKQVADSSMRYGGERNAELR